jgi:hypothetical protein
MNYKKMLRALHLAGTVWFMLCLVYLLILVLRQAGFNWWAIFSLSGHLALLIMLLVSLYLFSIFRGASDSATLQDEHPLTSTLPYMVFYVLAPLLGGAVGLVVMFGETKLEAIFSGIALATMTTTFLTWVVVDCIAGSLEMLTPEARKHRSMRLTEMKLKKEQHEAHRKQILAGVDEQARKGNQLWQESLSSQARRLAELLDCDCSSFSLARQEAIKLGVAAWRTGGLNCMKQLRDMAIKSYRQKYKDGSAMPAAEDKPADYISVWWDGLGSWRNQPFVSG